MRQLPLSALALALVGVCATAAWAVDDDPTPATRGGALLQHDPGERAPVRPTDLRPELPALQEKVAFVEFARHRAGVGYSYSIDPATLSVVGDEVRVAVRVSSGKGAETVTYEGFDCPDDAYRIYAYGSAGNTVFKAVRRLRWRSARAVDSTSSGGYRKVLIYELLCDPVRPRSPDAIRTRLRRR